MIKTIFTCALLALASAQNLQDLANQANNALAPVLNQANPVAQVDDGLSLVLNEYEFFLTEQNGEYELNVNLLPSNANNVAPTLAALLANVGNVGQNSNNAVDNVLDTEAQNVGVTIQDGSVGNAASQYSSQLSQNAGAIGAAAQANFDQAAAALAANNNGVADQVNQQINQDAQNPEALSASLNNAASQAAQDLGSADLTNLGGANIASLPVQVNANTASNAASSVNTNQAVSSLGDYTNQALNAGANAAGNSLPNGVANAVDNAANNAADSAANGLNNAASSLNVNNLADVTNVANGTQ